MAEESTQTPLTMAGFLRAFPAEMLCVMVCASWLFIMNCCIGDSYDFTVGASPCYVPHYEVYGWPARWLRTQTKDWLPRDEQVHYEFNWTGLMLNATFTIAIGVLGVLGIAFLRRRRFTLATGAVFVFYICIAAGALSAALSL